MEPLKMHLDENYERTWVTGLCRTHFANHRGCRAIKMKRWIEKAGYYAHMSNGCIDTTAPWGLLKTLEAKL